MENIVRRTRRELTTRLIALLFIWDAVVFFVIRILPFTREHLIGGLSTPSMAKLVFRLESIFTTYGWVMAIGTYLNTITHGGLSRIYLTYGTIIIVAIVTFWILITGVAGYIFARIFLWISDVRATRRADI